MTDCLSFFQEKCADLLRAICDDPTDDTSRLVYADLLEEYGDESEQARAEYIRVQIELNAMERHHYRECTSTIKRGAEVRPLRRRMSNLLTDDNRQTWFALSGLGLQLEGGGEKLFWWIQPSGLRIEAVLRRGFVAVVSCTDEAFRRYGPLLVRRYPLEEVRITDKIPSGPRWNDLCGDRVGWYGGKSLPQSTNDLPADVWYELTEGEVVLEGWQWKFYETVEHANRDLSSAYLRWARKQPDPTVSNPEGLD